MPCRHWLISKMNRVTEPRTLVLVIGESTQRGRMSLYGYPRETTPELDALHKTDPNLTVFNNVVSAGFCTPLKWLATGADLCQ